MAIIIINIDVVVVNISYYSRYYHPCAGNVCDIAMAAEALLLLAIHDARPPHHVTPHTVRGRQHHLDDAHFPTGKRQAGRPSQL